MFRDNDESNFDNELDDSKVTDAKNKMMRSCTDHFPKDNESDLVNTGIMINRNTAYDDSDSIFRSSLKGFFTGRSNNKTIYESSNSTKDSNEYSSLVSSNDKAFSGNPIKALKHNRK